MTVSRVSAATVQVTVCLLAVLLQHVTGQSCTNTTVNSTRLYSGGSSAQAGQVQICQCDAVGGGCSWRRVVASGSNREFWSWKNSLVVCRQLGFLGVQNPVQSLNVPPMWLAPLSTLVYFKVFQCDGTEQNITSCRTTTLSSSTPYSDAYINCRNSSSAPVFEDVQLSGGSTADSDGGLEVYLTPADGWVRVCPDGWDSASAEVVCRQLGYETGRTTVLSTSQFAGPLLGSHGVTSVQCSSTATDLRACTFVRSTSCSTQNIIGVNCTATSRPEGSTRLVDIPLDFLDRVEVVYNNRWGLVCDNMWTESDARVICRQSGLGNERSFGVRPTTSRSRPIWISDYDCIGSEDNLGMCRRSGVVGYSSDCSYSDASVTECTGATPVITTGGIIGIVMAVLVLGFFIVPFVCGYGREVWKKGKLRGWWRRQRSRMHTWRRNIHMPSLSPQMRRNRQTRQASRPRSRSVPVGTEAGISNTRSSSTSTNTANTPTTAQNEQANFSVDTEPAGVPKLPSNPKYAPPPSYDEALQHPDIGVPFPIAAGGSEEPEKPPYTPPSVLPYPVDPAYPPPVMVVPSYPPPINAAIDPAYPPPSLPSQAPDGQNF